MGSKKHKGLKNFIIMDTTIIKKLNKLIQKIIFYSLVKNY